MNATDMFLSLFSDRGSALTDSQASIRPAAMTSGQEAFSQTFARVLETRQQPAAKSQAAFQQQSADAGRPQAADKREAAPHTERMQAKESAARADSAREQQASAKLRTETRSNSECRADDASATSTTEQSKATARDQAVDAELREVVERLEQKVRDAAESGDLDEQMQELILDLLALLLAGRNEGEDMQALADKLGISDLAEVDGLTLTFFMDKDSELYNLVSMLMNDENGMDPDMLDQIKLLVKLAGDKAVEVAVSELTNAAGNQDESTMLSLTFGAQGQDADSEQVSISIRLTPEGAQTAQMVSMKDGQAPATEAALLVPAELLSKEDLEALVAQQQTQAGEAAKAAAGTRIMVQDSDQAGKPHVLIPMAGTMDAAKPEVLTADAMLKDADIMLKQLDIQALAQEISAMSKPREELAARFEQLLGSKSTAETLALLTIAGKTGGFDFLGDFMQRFGQEADADSQKWQADLFQQQVKAQLNSDRASTTMPTMDTGSERITFLGRSESAQNLFQQTVQETATSSRPPHTGAHVQESVMNQVVNRISFAQYNAQGGEIRIGLRPEHLGDLQMKIRIDHDIVTAKFVAESHEVKAIIESNLGQLRDALAEAGVKVGRFEVSVDTGAQQQRDHSEPGNPGHNGQTETAVSATDLAAEDPTLRLVDDVIYSLRPMAIAAYRHNYLA